MDNFKETERRSFIRIPFWFITKYRIYPYEAGSANDFKKGIGRNIGAGGICFEADDNFPVSTILEVELDMPALDHAVRVIGQIAWTKHNKDAEKYIYGLAFTKVEIEDIEAVKKIVEVFT